MECERDVRVSGVLIIVEEDVSSSQEICLFMTLIRKNESTVFPQKKSSICLQDVRDEEIQKWKEDRC